MTEARFLSFMRAIFSCLLVGLAASCGNGDPVRESIGRVVAAAEKRDAAAVVEMLSPDFQSAEGAARADVESLLRRYFAAYENLDVEISDLSIERAERAARATFRADLSGKVRKIGGLEGILPSGSSWRFEVRLVPAEDRWTVAWVSYQPAPGR
ncbi:MAG: hypothetical protein ABR576_05070 [Thermoanaerobaculia bacterium]